MGCWNKTCGVTQFPIMAGDDVVTFILVESGWKGEVHPTYIGNNGWHVIPVPLFGEYNDYGWMESSDKSNSKKFKFLTDHFNSNVIANPAQADRAKLCYKDLKAPFDNIESIGDSIHGDVFHLKNGLKYEDATATKRLSAFMMHKSVWDKFTSENVDKMAKALDAFKKHVNSLIPENADEIMQTYYDMCKQKSDGTFTTEQQAELDALTDKAFDIINHRMNRHSMTIDAYVETNYYQVKYWWHSPEICFLRWVYGDSWLHDSGMAIAPSEMFEAGVLSSKDLARVFNFMCAMNKLRKQFIPQVGEGSQAGFSYTHKVLMEAMEGVLEQAKKRWEEYADEDDEWLSKNGQEY